MISNIYRAAYLTHLSVIIFFSATLIMVKLSMLLAATLLINLGILDLQGRGHLGVALVGAITQNDRYNLMNFLFTNYKPEVRPTTAGEATYVYIGIYLLSIQNLDEKSQVLETSIIVDAEWFDDYLQWNASDYGGVDYFLYPQKKVWLPDIVIENSVESQKQFGYDENVVYIDSFGLVNWKPSQVIKTGCDIDVTYYPFDTQTCNIIISTWFSTKEDIDVDHESGSTGLLLDRYSVSGTWELISNEFKTLPPVRGRTRIQFQIKMRRRRTFYILNIVLPVLFLSFTASVVFLLPADAGEKIGMGITVLLAYAVYLTIIADNMPQTSLQVSYLAVYLTLLLGLTAMGVVLAVVVLHIHHKSDECRIGKRTQKVIRKLRTLLRINRRNAKCREKSEEESRPERRAPDTCDSHKKSVNAITPLNDKVTFSTPPPNEESQEEITWSKVAETVDRIMFFVTSFLIAGITLIFLPFLANGNT